MGSIRHVALQRQGPQSLMSAAAVGPPPTALWVLPCLLPTWGPRSLCVALPLSCPRPTFGAAQAVGGMCVALRECRKHPGP